MERLPEPGARRSRAFLLWELIFRDSSSPLPREGVMNSDIESFRYQLISIEQDAPGLWRGLSDTQFSWRAAPGRWSIGDCFDHLNQTARAYVPVIDQTIERARARGLTSNGPFVHGPLERMFIRSMEPPPRYRVRGPRVFQPSSSSQRSVTAVSREFLAWQRAIDERIARADGVDLRRARGPSPAVPLIRWSLGAMLAVMLAHERRHLWQAREVRREKAFPSG